MCAKLGCTGVTTCSFAWWSIIKMVKIICAFDSITVQFSSSYLLCSLSNAQYFHVLSIFAACSKYYYFFVRRVRRRCKIGLPRNCIYWCFRQIYPSFSITESLLASLWLAAGVGVSLLLYCAKLKVKVSVIIMPCLVTLRWWSLGFNYVKLCAAHEFVLAYIACVCTLFNALVYYSVLYWL